MKLNLNNLNPGIFYPWTDEYEDKGITVRPMIQGMADEINDTVTATKKVYKNGQVFKDVTIDDRLREEMIWDYCIVTWSGLEDDSGAEIPCTRENKITLMREHPAFPVLVSNLISRAEQDMSIETETEEKN